MSEAKHDGGPAFPVPYSNEADGPMVMPTTGMTLRDYFAAKALQGLLANPERYKYIALLVDTNQITQEEATTKNIHKAVMMADALLAELNPDQPTAAHAASEGE